jgi:hypothetical protein
MVLLQSSSLWSSRRAALCDCSLSHLLSSSVQAPRSTS